jgi:molecular chaperone DnaJ
MVKNCYIALGIGRGANIRQIKKAYREIAKKYHPDTTHSGDSQRFREIKEAYETLSDEDARRRHDAQLGEQDVSVRIESVAERINRRGESLFSIKRFQLVADEFFEGFIPGFFQKERYRPPRKDLYYEMILSPHEALQGGLFPIRVPVLETCPRCEVTGFWSLSYCPECNGMGHRYAERELSVSIPPRTVHGTEAVLSLEDIGLPDVNLFLRIQIDLFSA